MTTDARLPPKSVIPPSRWKEFTDWANDGGYDESRHDRWDSKSVELQRQFLQETEETEAS